jgi:hypothetical protein
MGKIHFEVITIININESTIYVPKITQHWNTDRSRYNNRGWIQ